MYETVLNESDFPQVPTLIRINPDLIREADNEIVKLQKLDHRQTFDEIFIKSHCFKLFLVHPSLGCNFIE